MKTKPIHFSEKTRLHIVSVAVGVLCGLAAVILKTLIHWIESGLTSWFTSDYFDFLYLVYPGIGMLLSLLFVKYVVKEDISHGVTKVLLAVSKNDSKIGVRNTWASLVASSVTIGFGGSVGAEAPIVYTGAAIGSNMGRKAGLSNRSMKILIGCGSAAAIAGIFKAPLAGVLFTLEILLFNISMSSILPVLLSSITATVVTYLLLGNEVAFAGSIAPFSMGNMPFYLVLGLFCGAMSLYFMRVTLRLEDRMRKIRGKWTRWAVGALMLGLLIFLFPPLYGEGYDSLSSLLNNASGDLAGGIFGHFLDNPWAFLGFAAAILLLKVFATAFTNAGGGVGGTFGPTLVSGGVAGFVVARLINLSGIAVVPEANFVLVGMGGMMAGVMQAPMTAIFLIAEITGGYELFLPLILTSAISFATMRSSERYSIYTKRIAAQGELLTHDSDQAVLTLLKTTELIETDFKPVPVDGNLGDMVKAISKSRRSVFPVVDARGHFCVVIYLDDVRAIMFDSSLYQHVKVKSLLRSAQGFVYEDEKMESVMEKFERTGAWNLPVVDDENKFLGFVSKSRIFTSYRDQLKELSDE